jgi:predicted component of type VI protein secretion system
MELKFFLIAIGLLLAACSSQPKLFAEDPSQNASLSRAPQALRLVLEDGPSIGSTAAGQELFLGGLSALRFLSKEPGGTLRFFTLTDRGPNGEEIKDGKDEKRPFLIPDYQPRIVFLSANPELRTLKVEKQIFLTKPDGQPLSGLPPAPGNGTVEVPINSIGDPLPRDPFGADPEGIAMAEDGSFWISEEYGPSLLHFSSEGRLLETMKPGNGLPKALVSRALNKGLEGFVISGKKAFAALQSPLDPSMGRKRNKEARVVRIIELNLNDKLTTAQYVYVLDNPKARIGDIAMEKPGVLLVLEQDGKAGPASKKGVFRARIGKATNLQLLPEKLVGLGGSVDGMTPAQLKAAQIEPLKKEMAADLTAAGVLESKVEGIDPADGYLALITDNDFDLAGPVDFKSGEAELKGEKPALYLLQPSLWKK